MVTQLCEIVKIVLEESRYLAQHPFCKTWQKQTVRQVITKFNQAYGIKEWILELSKPVIQTCFKQV